MHLFAEPVEIVGRNREIQLGVGRADEIAIMAKNHGRAVAHFTRGELFVAMEFVMVGTVAVPDTVVRIVDNAGLNNQCTQVFAENIVAR